MWTDSFLHYTVGISLAVIIPLYVLAFFSEHLQRVWSKIRGVWMPLIALPILWALDSIPFVSSSRFSLFALYHSHDTLRTVQRYDPKFEQNIVHMMGENGTEVVEDDDLDEEDDLIRLWRMHIKGLPMPNDEEDFIQLIIKFRRILEKWLR
jgi:hypothetical protein